MTQDNSGNADSEGDPGQELEPSDVIVCRECKSMVRRINKQHLTADRCKYMHPLEDLREHGRLPEWERDDHPESVEEYKEKHPEAPVVSPRLSMEIAQTHTDEEVTERRKRLVRRRWRGESMTRIVADLAASYDCSERTVWEDWRRREEWIGRVFGIEEAEPAILEAMARKKDVVDRLSTIAARAQNENKLQTALQAYQAVGSQLDDIIDEQHEFAEAFREGEVPAGPDQTIEVSGEVNHNHDIGDLSPEEAEALDALTGGPDSDVIAVDSEDVTEEE